MTSANEPTKDTSLSDVLHAATTTLESQSGSTSKDLTTTELPIPDSTPTSIPTEIATDAQTTAVAQALGAQVPKYSVQRDNLAAELQSRQDSLTYSISMLNSQMATAQTKYETRQKEIQAAYTAQMTSLQEDFNTLHEAYQSQLDDANDALKMVQQALGSAKLPISN